VTEIKKKRADLHGVYNIVETFIEDEPNHALIQLLSVFEMNEAPVAPLYAKASFAVKDKRWRLEKLGDRERVSMESYYEMLLSSATKAVEPKARIAFSLDGARYSLESNTERNYSVVQVDHPGDATVHHEHLLKNFLSIEVLGELYMSLEETFARLHLDQRPAGTLEDAVSILKMAVTNENKKAGI
jgi:hypothetical protein